MLLSLTQVKATHLVGGYLTYECLGNNNYIVKLRVYRDCNPGTAAFSTVATVTVYDQFYSKLSDIGIAKGPTIPIYHDSACTIIPPGVCVEYADYIDTVNLPPLAGGYNLNYRSCCRNGLIVNIPRPLNTNYIYNTFIPSMDTSCNTSPQLLGHSPVFLCHNQPIDFKLETLEPDGDSLHFELCDIMQNTVGIVPPDPIVFSPPYSSQYPMDASPPFGIDPQTGELLGTPTKMGHYVVGICVTEYRNGSPLSTVRLDYQFNVTTCINITADILTQAEDSTLYCQGLNMQFFTQNTNASSFFWDFGDTTTTADTSSASTPFYHYSQPGFYEVTLVADPGGCSDTARAIFEVKELLNPEFNNDGIYCFSDQPLNFSPTGQFPPGSRFHWDFGTGASVSTSDSMQPPPVSWGSGGTYYIEFSVHYGKCVETRTDTIIIRDELIADMLTPDEDSSLTCNGLTVQFFSQSTAATSYLWDFGDPTSAIDVSTQRDPSYTYPVPGVYTVSLQVFQDSACTAQMSWPIEVQEALEPEINISGRFCYESQAILAEAGGTYPGDTKFRWHFGADAERTVRTGRSTDVRYTAPGLFPVQLISTRGYCSDTLYDSIEVLAFTVPIDAGDTQYVDQKRFVRLQSTSAHQVYWFANQPVQISSPFSEATSAQLLPGTDSIKFYVKATDVNGCQGIDSMYVYVEGEDNRLSNYISPNGDGLNDYLDLSAAMKGSHCRFTIMNRWGSEVYHGEQGVTRWEGVNDAGDLLSDATYYYIVYCHPQVMAQGAVTIIRGNRQ